jgi:hypothetical protein
LNRDDERSHGIDRQQIKDQQEDETDLHDEPDDKRADEQRISANVRTTVNRSSRSARWW